MSTNKETTDKRKGILSAILAGFMLGGVTVVYGLLKIGKFFRRHTKRSEADADE